MAEKFDEFSKHLAAKQSRRGLFKFMGAGIVSAFVATVTAPSVDARFRPPRGPQLNDTLPPKETLPPKVNQTLPESPREYWRDKLRNSKEMER